METYASPYIKQIAGGSCYVTLGALTPVLRDSLVGWDGKGGEDLRGRGPVYTCC